MSKLPVRQALERMAHHYVPQEGRAGKLRLDFNENTIGCPPAVLRALRQLSREQVAMYPEYQATTRKLAKFFGVEKDELLLTNGADEALRLVVDTFVDPDSYVLIVEPTFPMYRFYGELVGGRMVSTRYGDQMGFPLEVVLEILSGRAISGQPRPRVFFLANPNNPTGTLVPQEGLRQILEAAEETVVVVDEAYWEFSGATVLPWIRHWTNLVITRTFSKATGMAGLRLGCVFAGRETLGVLRQAREPFPVNTAALVAAEAAIRDPEFIRAYVRAIEQGKRILLETLNKMKVPVFPTAGNFLLADFGARGRKILSTLARRRILLRDRRGDFPREGYVRITIGTPAQMRRLAAELRKLA